jgi:hypothetical protein
MRMSRVVRHLVIVFAFFQCQPARAAHPCEPYGLPHQACYPNCNRAQSDAAIARWTACLRRASGLRPERTVASRDARMRAPQVAKSETVQPAQSEHRVQPKAAANNSNDVIAKSDPGGKTDNSD